jgi:hypothetical protein
MMLEPIHDRVDPILEVLSRLVLEAVEWRHCLSLSLEGSLEMVDFAMVDLVGANLGKRSTQYPGNSIGLR